MAINIGKKNFKAQGTDTKDYVNYMVDKRLGEIDAHMAGTDKKHNAKDITYSGDYYEDEPNVEDAINYLGGKTDEHSGNIAGNFKSIQTIKADITVIKEDVATNASFIRALDTQVESNTVAISENSAMISEVDERLSNQLTGIEGRIDNNDSDIQTLKDTSKEHTTSINNIIDDLVTRPTAEWAENVATDLGNKEERVSALEKLTSESLPDLDAQIQGNKASIEVLSITVGNIETALDSIIAMQNALIGGDSV